MKILSKTLAALALAFAAAALLPAGYALCAENMTAVVVYVGGDVKLKRAGAAASSELKLNEALQPGDSITTGAGAKASLVTKGGAEVRINENTTLTMPGKSRVREMYDLLAGQVWSRMLHTKAKLSVRTPSAVCAIRGTEADIEQKELLTVRVYEGHVDLQNAHGKQSLRAGQISTVTGANAAPAAPRQMSGSEQGKWQEDISVKDIGKYLEQVGLTGSGDKKLKLKLDKEGKAKDVEIKLKKK